MCVCETATRFDQILKDIYASRKRSKSSNIDRITVAGGISKGLVVQGRCENWALKDGQVFGYRGSIFVRPPTLKYFHHYLIELLE